MNLHVHRRPGFLIDMLHMDAQCCFLTVGVVLILQFVGLCTAVTDSTAKWFSTIYVLILNNDISLDYCFSLVPVCSLNHFEKLLTGL